MRANRSVWLEQVANLLFTVTNGNKRPACLSESSFINTTSRPGRLSHPPYLISDGLTGTLPVRGTITGTVNRQLDPHLWKSYYNTKLKVTDRLKKSRRDCRAQTLGGKTWGQKVTRATVNTVTLVSKEQVLTDNICLALVGHMIQSSASAEVIQYRGANQLRLFCGRRGENVESNSTRQAARHQQESKNASTQLARPTRRNKPHLLFRRAPGRWECRGMCCINSVIYTSGTPRHTLSVYRPASCARIKAVMDHSVSLLE